MNLTSKGLSKCINLPISVKFVTCKPVKFVTCKPVKILSTRRLVKFGTCKPVKILSTRIAKIGHERTLRKYLKELNKNVYSLDGFKKAESFWVPMSEQSIRDFTSKRMITISEWKHLDDWKNWLKSEVRINTNEKYADILEMEEHLKLEYIPSPPIFLL